MVQSENQKGGICCPKCGCQHLRVVATRKWVQDKILRVRRCRNCGKKVRTTEEKVAK